MKQFYYTIFIFLLGLLTLISDLHAQAPEFLWVNQSSSVNSAGTSVVTDAVGNTYVTGSFTGTITIGGQPKTSSGSYDIFVAKYNAAGSLQWVQYGGGAEDDQAFDIAVDAWGNVYVTGKYKNSATFGSTSVKNNNNSFTLFVTKYDPFGNVQWVTGGDGLGMAISNAIAVDKNGNSYVTGSFTTTTKFGDYTLTNNTGSKDIFIVSFNPSGIPRWSIKAGSTDTDGNNRIVDEGKSIAVDKDDNVFVTGFFASKATFSSNDLAKNSVALSTSSNPSDIFIAKYNSNGALQWAKAVGEVTKNEENHFGVTTDETGNAYITSAIEDKKGQNTTKMLLAQYSPSGQPSWKLIEGGAGTSKAFDLAYGKTENKSGYLYVTGSFTGTATFGNPLVDSKTPTTPTSLTSAGFGDMFIAKYEAATGKLLGAYRSGGPNEDVGFSISQTNDHASVAGYFNQSASIGTTTLTNSSGKAMFAAKFGKRITWTGTNSDSWTDAGNWSGNLAPTTTDEIIIPANLSRYPNINSATTINNIILEAGTSSTTGISTLSSTPSLTIATGGNLTVLGSLTLNTNSFLSMSTGSALTINGELLNLNGSRFSTASGATVKIANKISSFVPEIPYANLEVEPTNGTHLSLSNNITVNGNLRLKGKLGAASGKVLTLNGNIENEDVGRFYEGKLLKKLNIGTNTTSQNFGDIGVTIKNEDGGDWGEISVNRTTGAEAAVAHPTKPNIKSVQRRWEITSTKSANKNVWLNLSWLMDEDNMADYNAEKIQVWHSVDDGLTWHKVGVPTLATVTGNKLAVDVRTALFGIFTLSKESDSDGLLTPLPVELIHFTAKKTQSKTIKLTWATASEKDNEYFAVERSADGTNFTPLDKVKGAGNSNQRQEYTFTDNNPLTGTAYYRLRQTDFNGKTAYSPIRAVANNFASGPAFKLYPNPAHGEQVQVSLQGLQEKASLEVTDLQGKRLRQQSIKPNTNQPLPINGLPAGTYLVRIFTGAGSQIQKLIIQ
ncbi:T9SS type A sorting domain-containing protein [Adhaeribacter aquaticus]|uniref:T9SS type A sorting domain-containing protein n=1 Tax=Adhaeribacter aquaticus TaxID=299567 RepID=UPI0004086D08|nr:T9SS type A sorting domain-containing protein [Adhaeribacter aquaticus]